MKNTANRRILSSNNYSDQELLSFLESNNYELSFKNLEILKEGLRSGAIELIESKNEDEENVNDVTEQEVENEVENEAPTEEQQAEETGAEPRVSIEIPNDGSMTISTDTKQIFSDAENNVNVSLAESLKYLSTKNSERFLNSFLVEDCKMKESDVISLREEEKTESVKTIIISLLNDIQEKLTLIDTVCADRSRGDIKQLRELSVIQDAITQLEALIDRDDSSLPVYSNAINTIIKAILYINQYSSVFKDAYRNKKTLMIMKYQSLILSIISAITYLTSTILMYDSNGVHIKASDADIITFPPLVSLSNFIRSVDNGEFRIISRDVNIVREFYLEVPIETMSNILEATEYTPMIIDGFKGILSNMGLDSNKLTNLVYKTTGIVILLLSVRDVFYTIASMKTKVPDMLTALQNFVNINSSSSALGKVSQFTKKFEVDAENGAVMANREIEDQNRDIVSDIKSLKSNASTVTVDSSNVNIQTQPSASNIDFGFDF